MSGPCLRMDEVENGVQELTSERVEWLVRELVRVLSGSGGALEDRNPGGAPEEILLDIHLDGERYLLVHSQSRAPGDQAPLSPRELEIARMVAEGYPNKTIAEVLDISCWTVGTHLRRIFAKLGVRSRAAMVARLLEEGTSKEPSYSGDMLLVQRHNSLR